MGYAFFSRSSSSLELEGQRLSRLRALAQRAADRLPADGRPPRTWQSELVARRPALDAALRRITAKTVPSPPSAAVIVLHRLGFGPRPGDVEAFEALGASDAERLAAHLDQQLVPASIDDSAAEARIAQSGFTTLDKSLTQLWQDHVVADPPWEIAMQPFFETEMATFLRAIHSRRQLFEVMVDFWHNHFNVFAFDLPIGPIWVHTDRDAIRAHALGNFRQLLEAVAMTPAMLFYLDNWINTQEDANENYAREMLELHSLGADAYFGSIPESEIPLDGNGDPLGYSEETVIAAARCLTGWTVAVRPWDPAFGNEGTFLYHDPWHDHQAKTVLGADLPANQAPMKDGRDLFDLVARHPATGRHVATKIARRLLGDFPPASVIDAAAAIFTAQWQAPDQIAQAIRSIVLSDAFLTTWGDKVKRPFEITAGAFRGAGTDLPFAIGDSASNYFLYAYYQTGQPLFSWHPPNGYPDFKTAWNSTSPRVMSWRLANLILTIEDRNNVPYADVLGQTPADVRSAREIVTFWTERVLGRPMAEPEFDALVHFMAQGRNPEFDLPLDTDEETQTRLRALVALILMSPSFLWR